MRAALTAGLLLIGTAVTAATVTVVPGAPDAIAAAAKGLQPGDTLLIRAGMYAGNINLNLRGTADQPITIKGEGAVIIEGRAAEKTGWQPVPEQPEVYATSDAGPIAGMCLDLPSAVQGVEPLEPCRGLAEVAKCYQGFWFDAANQRLYIRLIGGAAPTGHTVWVLRDGGGLGLSGEHVRVEGLTLQRFAGGGIGLWQARDVTVEHCTISHCGAVWSAGLSLGQTVDITIQDCLIYRVRNGVLAQDADRTRLIHSTIYHTRAHGVYLVSGNAAVLRDNIVYAGGGSGSALYVGPPAAPGLQADSNCFLDTGTRALINWMPLGLTCPTLADFQQALPDLMPHSFSADPLFVSTAPGSEDFHLQPVSPCRGRASDGTDVGCRYP